MCADTATSKLPLLSACLQLCAQGCEREHSATLRNKISRNKACLLTVSKQRLLTSPSGLPALNATWETIQSKGGWGTRTHSRHNYLLDHFVFLFSGRVREGVYLSSKLLFKTQANSNNYPCEIFTLVN